MIDINLSALLNKESGIIIYDDEVLICNWSSIEKGRPEYFNGNIYGVGDFLKIINSKNISINKINNLLKSKSIINTLIDYTIDESGLIYTIEDNLGYTFYVIIIPVWE